MTELKALTLKPAQDGTLPPSSEWKIISLIFKSSALIHHPTSCLFTQFFNSIYQGAVTAVTSNKEWTEFIKVEKGVLQGDPCSPLLFNLCFNLLMQVLTKPELKNLGYFWGPKHATFESSWLQFADDAAIISNSTRDTRSTALEHIRTLLGAIGLEWRSGWTK